MTDFGKPYRESLLRPPSPPRIDMMDLYRNVVSDPEYVALWCRMAQAVPSVRERKIAEAKAWLGSKWVLHPANAVKRKVTAPRAGITGG